MKLAPSISLILSGLLALHQAAQPTHAVSGHSDPLARKAYVQSLYLRSPPPWHNQRRSVPLPAKRDYDSHHYYVVELQPHEGGSVDPRDVAAALDAEYVEQAGELKHHYLMRFAKRLEGDAIGDASALEKREHAGADVGLARRQDYPLEDDPVLRRWGEIRRARSVAGPGSASNGSLQLAKRHERASVSIRGVERQELRMRHKRDRIYVPEQMPDLYPEIRAALPGADAWASEVVEAERKPPMMPAAKTAAMIGEYGISDPIFVDQWHLANDRREGFDLNLTDVWKQDIHGRGVNVCLIDDGLDMHSHDLADNFFAAGSYDFNAHTELPEPRESDDQHGTRCAGEIAALKNDVCGVGVAYHAKVSGVRILSGPISDVDEAAALNYAYQDNHVYSCSWGPPDDGRSMDAPKGLIAKAMLNGVQNGRDGKGSIFVFAGGNGGASDDQCNFDGYTNSIYSMTIAAVDREGQHPYYSEMCSAILATGWSSGNGDHIHTTDVAWNGVNRAPL
ncbi:uncharacterized protein PFL1_01903 [Pseudozyma flocculosa PF-1]|uniref:uncharacterized protein n=1 Tax=Pseudozyma flocculosa PF-1 TaxID=1277687 RepID=UPI000456154C|nr:uncharacterized protein PFL1_01903 [Pseudozyma flocculosa PF-1]EPQ30377.1 hypothetical protein PFL1_01903 [Pseudozyma flocculosa PF-1]